MRMKTLEHQWLDVLCGRGGGGGKDVQELKRLAAGYEGECELDRWLRDFGRPHWKIFRDIWIDAGGTTQIDTLVVTGEGIHVFDVKNYSGELEYVDGKWWSGGRRLNKDIFIQLKRSMEKMGVMHHRIGGRGRLTGRIVFVGEHGRVHVKDAVDVEVVMRHDIRRMIHKLADDEHWNDVLDIGEVARAVEGFMIECPYKPRELDDVEFSRLRRGVRCCACGGFGVLAKRYHIECSCGHVEPKEKAVLRTICEYGVLRHERDLKMGEVHQFLEGIISKVRLSEILRKHFQLKVSGRHATYVNPRAEFQYIFKNIVFRYERVK